MATGNDSFTGTGTLQSHTSDSGHAWARGTGGGTSDLSINGTCYVPVGPTEIYENSFAPASAEYDVQGVFTTDYAWHDGHGIGGRLSGSAYSGYMTRWYGSQWQLIRYDSLYSSTSLGTFTGDDPSLDSGAPRTVLLQLRNAAKKVFIGGVERISSTDNTITATGKAGFIDAYSQTGTSVYWDNFVVTDAAAGGDTALSCAIRATATVAAALLTSIVLAGAMLGTGSVQAPLSTSIPLVSSAAASATVTSQLATGIPLSAAAQARANVSANLTTSIPLSSAASARATVAAELTTAMPLASATTARATLAADLTTAIPLASVSMARATVSASFEALAAELASAVQARANVSSALSTAISLSAQHAARATTAAADLTTAFLLAASSSAGATVQADLSVAANPSVVATHNTVHVTRNAPRVLVTPHATRIRITNRYNIVRSSNV